jgi:hypothetical protein
MFENTSECWREHSVHLRTPGSCRDKPSSADDMSSSTNDISQSVNDKPGSTSECQRQAWELLELLESCLGTMISLGTLLVHLEIIATTYH